MRTLSSLNLQRYHYQGIGGSTPQAAYARGLADFQVLANLIPRARLPAWRQALQIADAAICGFIANIRFDPIETPLKQFVDAEGNLVRLCQRIHAAIQRSAAGPRISDRAIGEVVGLPTDFFLLHRLIWIPPAVNASGMHRAGAVPMPCVLGCRRRPR